ncbi:glycosyltransferase [bacterium 1XD42-8]|nr:glycosyltransferase [bacterium 1XD42-8]
MRKDKVSFILTTYNCKIQLKKTLDSIIGQDYSEIEIVIVDGQSTDGTVDMIKDYSAKSEKDILWISEKDKGIYDAMNKGYSLSTGEIVVFFNERFLKKNGVTMCVEAMNSEEQNYCGVHSDLIYVKDKKIVRYWRMGQGKIKNGWMAGHPTLFLRREVYETYGLYHTDYKISADYEFMVRVFKDEELKLAYIPKVLIQMYYGGVSTKDPFGYLCSLREAHRALKENHIRGAFLIDIKRMGRLMMQFWNAKGKVDIHG